VPINPMKNDHSILQCKRGCPPPKKMISLKRMIKSFKPDIILLQEIMCSSKKSRETLELWFKKWSFCVVDTKGMSRGLITGWSPNFKASSSSYFRSSIYFKLRHKDNDFFFFSSKHLWSIHIHDSLLGRFEICRSIQRSPNSGGS
jgi:hypothetical protein